MTLPVSRLFVHGFPGLYGGAGTELHHQCYDETGNWRKYDNEAQSNLQQFRTHNRVNEICSVTNPSGAVQPAYDKAGNQTVAGDPADWTNRFDLKWDAWNRLVEVKDGTTVIQTNVYDGLTRRIETGDGTDTVHYYYNDEWRAVEEYRNSESTPERRYLWGLRNRWDLVKRLRDAGGSLDEERYVLHDAMDPVAICDGSGAVKQRYQYSPFGETTRMGADFTPSTASEDWNFLFHGEFLDGDTGLYNYGYRFYDPQLGRWMSRDTIEEEGGLNLYGFAGNDAVNVADLLGLKCEAEMRNLEAASLSAAKAAGALNGPAIKLWRLLGENASLNSSINDLLKLADTSNQQSKQRFVLAILVAQRRLELNAARISALTPQIELLLSATSSAEEEYMRAKKAYDDCASDKPKAKHPGGGQCPNNPPSSNGCGPESWKGRWYEQHVRAILNSGLGLADFKSACSSHDICWGTCGSDRSACDMQFLSDMLASCDNTYPTGGPLKTACRAVAHLFQRKVSGPSGDTHFKVAQEKGCECHCR